MKLFALFVHLNMCYFHQLHALIMIQIVFYKCIISNCARFVNNSTQHVHVLNVVNWRYLRVVHRYSLGATG